MGPIADGDLSNLAFLPAHQLFYHNRKVVHHVSERVSRVRFRRRDWSELCHGADPSSLQVSSATCGKGRRKPRYLLGRGEYFKDKDAEERFATLAKSTRTGGSCYVCHQKGSKRPLNAFGWAGEQLAMRRSPALTKARVEEVFKGKDTDEKNKLADLFADAALEALDYWVVLNKDGELELVKDATDGAGDPLSFGRRVAEGNLPTTDLKETSFESVFPQEVLDKLLAP